MKKFPCVGKFTWQKIGLWRACTLPPRSHQACLGRACTPRMGRQSSRPTPPMNRPQGRLNLPRWVCPGPGRRQRLEGWGRMLTSGRKPLVGRLEFQICRLSSFVLQHRKKSWIIDFVWRFSIQGHKSCAKFGLARNFLINLALTGWSCNIFTQYEANLKPSDFKLKSMKIGRNGVSTSLNGCEWIIHTTHVGWKHDDDMFWQFYQIGCYNKCRK